MNRKQFKIWITDLKLWEYVHSKKNISEYLVNLVKNDFEGTTGNLKETKLIKEIEKLKLDNQLKRLLIWKELKIHGYTLEESKKFISTEEKIENRYDELTKESFMKNGVCEQCNHYHTDKEPRVCTVTSCICGMR